MLSVTDWLLNEQFDVLFRLVSTVADFYQRHTDINCVDVNHGNANQGNAKLSCKMKKRF